MGCARRRIISRRLPGLCTASTALRTKVANAGRLAMVNLTRKWGAIRLQRSTASERSSPAEPREGLRIVGRWVAVQPGRSALALDWLWTHDACGSTGQPIRSALCLLVQKRLVGTVPNALRKRATPSELSRPLERRCRAAGHGRARGAWSSRTICGAVRQRTRITTLSDYKTRGQKLGQARRHDLVAWRRNRWHRAAALHSMLFTGQD